MNQNQELLICVVLVMGAVGAFCVGGLWGMRRVMFWRIKWIELEHDLARLQNRKPRDVFEMEPASGASRGRT
jgi:hypothetical protein